MTTSSAVETVYSAPVTSGSRYSLVISSDREHREAAQRLRYRVFSTEPGFVIPVSPDGRDADRFDDFCDHLLIRDNATTEFVGCYRMLPPDGARAAGGYYTATEFDLTALDPAAGRVVEMGRACVEAAHRSGSVLGLMWSGILHYLQLTGHDTVMGCVSVPMQDGPDAAIGANVRAVRDFLLDRHAADRSRWAVPLRPVRVDGRALDDIEAPARAQVPPLLRGYLRLGARICGEPAHDPDFGVADFVALQSLHAADTRYLDRLRRASATLEAAA
ncbi:GNAT family N-acetyltransferase [Rhodococcus sp. SGAir0479]|uniref:GNAT family N-acetyltransferase n=1 Tax=Rhodococcus sp. SGAir0479 TaxID=2567884 RepID=UPI0010CD5430|nr:GNAT family N-acyltransferase [Rhodococcus sp. SGAir0479]QCQ91863.1 GNAT family N-acetyltransferase [Rhodococcus sp. SGAir0479]